VVDISETARYFRYIK